MALRQDLINSAVVFLQDPSVANAALDKRIAFLESKNLTKDEIDAALAQAGGVSPASSSSSQPSPGNYGYQPQQSQQYGGYGPYQGGYWQPPPPDVPRRDWRDYFIMATVVGGLGYGAYFLAKRYVVPLIAPPTPPQLEQDKASIDASFSRAFALIDQLTTDTAAIQKSEAARTDKLDAALSDMEAVVGDMKASTRRRDDDGRRINDELRALQALVPKAIKSQEDATDARLKELNAELRSLKTLITNRMSGQGVAQAGVQRAGPTSAAPPATAVQTTSPGLPGTPSVTGPSGVDAEAAEQVDRSNTGSPFNRFGRSGGIPEWQRAAAKKSEEAVATSESETGTAAST